MRRLGLTVARLDAIRRGSMGAFPASSGRLAALADFGANPGALNARVYLPAELAPGAPLVVVLHGCTQNATAYDQGSGWSKLAERHGFALLYPEQSRANNHNLCFNWYDSGDSRRGRGEAASIAQMVRFLVAKHKLDADRVFISGLSAGGAMTAVMLATYPELFAGGAIIAGLPFAVAEGVPEALERMRGQGMPPRATLARRVVAVSGHRGPWPTLSVWHGTADHVVNNRNAGAIIDQWCDRIGFGAVEGSHDRLDGHARTLWRDAKGRAMIERIDIAGMGHGVPIAPRDGCGEAGPHMLDFGLCSSSHLVATWGLVRKGDHAAKPARVEPATAPSRPAPRATGVTGVIEDALRAAGLMA